MTTDETNVIKFPKEKLLTPSNIQSQEDMLKQIVDYKTNFANDLSEFLSQHIFGELARSGVNFEAQIDDLFPSMVLVTEAIQSLQLKASGVYHPLQDFAEEAFGEDEELHVDTTSEKDYTESSNKEDFEEED